MEETKRNIGDLLLESLREMSEIEKQKQDFINEIEKDFKPEKDEIDRRENDLLELYPVEWTGFLALSRPLRIKITDSVNELVSLAAVLPESLGDYLIGVLKIDLKRLCGSTEKNWTDIKKLRKEKKD